MKNYLPESPASQLFLSSIMAEWQASVLYFDPDKFTEKTLKALLEFVEDFELRYDASYPDSPKNLLRFSGTAMGNGKC